MKKETLEKIIYVLIAIFVLLVLLIGFVPDYGEELFSKNKPQLEPFDATVTVSDNVPPNITSYYPLELNLNVSGTDELYFNATYEDADGDPLSVFWYVDNNLAQEVINDVDLFDEFNFTFGCDISGQRNVRVDVSDGVSMDSVEWSIDVGLVACSSNGNGNGNGGNGGGGGIANFSISRSLVETNVVKGESARESILIENTGETFLHFDLSLTGLESVASLSHIDFPLSSGNSQLVDIDFVVGFGEPAGIRTGSISVIGGQITKTVNIILEILESETLFDLESELKDETLTKQQQIEAKIVMTDIGNLGSVEVLLEHFIKDFEDNETRIGEENLQVNGVLEIERTFDIPEDLELGEYLFYVKLSYQGNVVTSSNSFELIDVTLFFKILLFLLFFLIIIIFLFLIFYIKKKREEKDKKVSVSKGYEEENKVKIIQRYVKGLLERR